LIKLVSESFLYKIMLEDKKIALVHHWLVGMRGGEKIVESLCIIFPNIDIFTLVYDKNKVSSIVNSKKIQTSFIQSSIPTVYAGCGGTVRPI